MRSTIEEAIEDAVRVALAEAMPPPDDGISRQEMRDMLAEVQVLASPNSPAINQDEVAELVSKSIAETLALSPTPITRAEMEQLVRAEIALLRESLLAQAKVAPAGVPIPPLEEGKPTIVFSDLRRQSAEIQNRIAMFIVRHGYGYPVDSISGETLVLWDNLLDGDSLVTMEIVLPNQQEAWDEAIIGGAVIPLGESLDANWQGFVVPTYLTRRNALVDVGDITDEDTIRLFVAPGKELEREKKAVFVNCPVGTECHDINLAKLKAYKLEDDVEIIVPASFAALQDSLERAYLDRRSWLGYMFGPSRLSEELDLTILKEPEYSEQCWATTKGCAYPTARVLVAVHPSMLEIAPDVVRFLRKWDFTARRLIGSEKWMEDNNATVEETAIFFLKTWPSNWTKWVPNDVAQRVQAALREEVGPSG
ncbi:MAG: glycine betaine ABC transporter substrate-binding protein [Dehalococcoidia bacterium]